MSKKRPPKTNAMRLVEKSGKSYEVFTFPWKEDDHDARHVGQYLVRPDDEIFKTLVAVGDKSGPLVAVIPSNRNLDLKKLAAMSGNKRVEMLALKDLEKTTGYIRGGCSPLGMKRTYPTFIAQEVLALDQVLVSAGQRGVQMALKPADLIDLSGAITGDITF